MDAHAAAHLQPFIVAALETGGRLSELRALKWADVDLSRGYVCFDQATTKSKRSRRVPMSPRLRGLLQQRKRVRSIRVN